MTVLRYLFYFLWKNLHLNDLSPADFNGSVHFSLELPPTLSYPPLNATL